MINVLDSERDSGIDIIGKIPWGTHFCQFYETRDDLKDILISYFKAGLESNEYCMWITSEPFNVEDTMEAMRNAMNNFDYYLNKGQIEIVPHTKWYLLKDISDYQKVLNGWVEKLEHALKKGYSGLRLSGNTFWLEGYDIWADFAQYEQEINNMIGNYKMIAICTYSLLQCSINDILDVVNTHQFALIKQKGSWRLIENAEHKETKAVLRTEILERKKLEEKLMQLNAELEERVKKRTEEIIKTTLELKTSKKEQKLVEEQLLRQAELLDHAQDAIITTDLQYNIIYLNKSTQEFYGHLSGKVIGKSIDVLFIEATYLLHQAKKQVEKKGGWLGELQILTRDQEKKVVQSRWTIMKNKKGVSKSVMVINTDITEKNKLETELFRAQRIESINTLASGIAHDLNNVLTPIIMSGNVLKKKLTDDQSKAMLDIIESNAWRGANLLKQLMAFTKGVEGTYTTLQMAPIINDMKKILIETFPKNISFEINVADNLLPISGDETQLYQVLMNLCVNARDAMTNGGTLSITVENYFIDVTFTHFHVDAHVGPYILIIISDNGTGISPEIIDKIFDPFFTAKGLDKGMGLGLSITRGIVKSHGGFISVYSEYGKGATFNVYLPAVEEGEEDKALFRKKELVKGHGEKILLVDDEPEILEVFQCILEDNGYNVLTARNGAECIDLYTHHAKNVNLVIMDMIMPTMDGVATVRVLREINNQVKIIGTSGLLEYQQFVQNSDSFQAFLNKPCATDKILQIIDQVLNEKK